MKKTGTDNVPSLGKALRKSLGYEEVEEGGKRRGLVSLLMNEPRQNIFQFLCDRPCSHLRLIAREQKFSTPTADWHLKKMVNGRMVDVKEVGKKKVYYPAGFVEMRDIIALSILNEDLPRKIVGLLRESPGMTQNQLKEAGLTGGISRFLGIMVKEEILTIVIDGRFRHYYINDELSERDQAYKKRMRQFKKDLLRVLKDDGLSPKITKVRENYVEFEIRAGTKKKTLTIRTRPFSFLVSRM
jgi:hypothetical protein